MKKNVKKTISLDVKGIQFQKLKTILEDKNDNKSLVSSPEQHPITNNELDFINLDIEKSEDKFDYTDNIDNENMEKNISMDNIDNQNIDKSDKSFHSSGDRLTENLQINMEKIKELPDKENKSFSDSETEEEADEFFEKDITKKFNRSSARKKSMMMILPSQFKKDTNNNNKSLSFAINNKFNFLNRPYFRDDNLSVFEDISSNRNSGGSIMNQFESFILPKHKRKKNVAEDSIIFRQKYSFTKTYMDLFKKQKPFVNFPKVLQSSLEVTIPNYEVEEGWIVNHVLYFLEGYKDNEKFDLTRKFKEFTIFRELLRKNWPGLFVPMLPPKKLFGNWDDSFILMRKKFLQYFLNLISKSPHLSSSFETKIFLEPKNDDFSLLPFEIYERSVEEIYNIYTKYFGFLDSKPFNEKEKLEIESFYELLNKVKEQFEVLSIIVEEAKTSEIENEKINIQFYEEKYLLEDSLFDLFDYKTEKKAELSEGTIEVNLAENLYYIKHENFFTTFLDFVLSTKSSLMAMIDTINTLYEFREMFFDRFEKIKIKNEELKNLLNVNWLYKFFFPIDLNVIQEKSNEVSQLQIEIGRIRSLIDIIYKVIYYIEMPTFKSDQYRYYLSFIKRLKNEAMNLHSKDISTFNLLVKNFKKVEQLLNEEFKKLAIDE